VPVSRLSESHTLGVSCGAPTVQTRLRLVDDHTQMKSHVHSDVVDDSAGRGFDVPARLRAKVAMAHASVVTAVCGRCRRARERSAFFGFDTYLGQLEMEAASSTAVRAW